MTYKYLTILLIALSANQPLTVDFKEKAGFPNLPADKYGDYSGYFGDAVVANSPVLTFEKQTKKQRQTLTAITTAYSSAPEQTDETPFITASGSYVRNGVAASNFLPFGTKFRIPKLFGNRVFVIEDRMHSRYGDRVDIWFTDEKEALKFGKQTAKIEIL